MYRIVVAWLCLTLTAVEAQAFDEHELGAWYMFMWSKNPVGGTGLGWQGDVQHRNWDRGGDLEQLLVRGGATWTPKNSAIKYTLGYAHVTSGTYGASEAKSKEHRLYQEALLPHTVGERAYFTHRVRLEQRDLDGQSTRNRVRYFAGLNYPLNQATLGKGAVYLALYNEVFFNLEQNIGSGRHVDYFDRNRAYAALGYSIADRSRLQFGYMHQRLDDVGKGQLQFSWVQSF